MKCTQCGHSLRPENNFCPNCGAPVPTEGSAKEMSSPIQETTDKISDKVSDGITDEITDEISDKLTGEKIVAPIVPPTPQEEPIASETPPSEPELPPQADGEMIEDMFIPPAPSAPQEQVRSRAHPVSEHTMDSIDLAISEDIEKRETEFEDPPLYIPQLRRSKAPIIIAIVLALIVVSVVAVFSLGDFSLPKLSRQSPIVLTNGRANLNYGMSKKAALEELGDPLLEEKDQVIYEDGISILYRDDKAVAITIKEAAGKKWRTSEKISIGDSRSKIFKAYGTDNLVSVLEDIGLLDDPAEISRLDSYLIPYQKQGPDDNYLPLSSVNQEYYEEHPLEYLWIAYRIGPEDTVDTIVLGDTLGVFEQK